MLLVMLMRILIFISSWGTVAASSTWPKIKWSPDDFTVGVKPYKHHGGRGEHQPRPCAAGTG
jgi:hypothetical protein